MAALGGAEPQSPQLLVRWLCSGAPAGWALPPLVAAEPQSPQLVVRCVRSGACGAKGLLAADSCSGTGAAAYSAHDEVLELRHADPDSCACSTGGGGGRPLAELRRRGEDSCSLA